MADPTKLERIANAVTMAVQTISRSDARPDVIVAMKLFVEDGVVILRARTRGGLVAAVLRADENATDDPDVIFSQIAEALGALAAKDGAPVDTDAAPGDKHDAPAERDAAPAEGHDAPEHDAPAEGHGAPAAGDGAPT